MRKIIALLSIVALAVLCGCASFVLPSPKQLDSLARDTNSIELDLQTIYGNMKLRRNMDRFAAVPWSPITNANSFMVTPETTLKVEKNK